MITSLPDFRLEVYLSRWEFAARYHLTASDAQTLTIHEVLELATEEDREAFERLPLGYTPNWGTERLLRAIAASYDTMSPEHVLTFAGAQEAIYWTIQELVGPGDHAVVIVPTFPSTESITVATGADVSGLLLRSESNWKLDVQALEAMLRPNTRLVAVNFPNNPTGAVPDHNVFRQLVELCDERGIRLLSDEVYRGLDLNPTLRLPQAADLSATAISLNVMSKAYGLPGLRIGWLASRDRSLLERLERRKHYTSVCNSAPSEMLAAIALENRERIIEHIRSMMAQNVVLFDDFFEHWQDRFVWSRPEGGCVSFPRYLGGEGVDAFCQKLVEEAGVVLLPASVFQSALADVPNDRFRISIGRRKPELALTALDRYLNRAPIAHRWPGGR